MPLDKVFLFYFIFSSPLMMTLSDAPIHIPLFVLEVRGNTDEKKYLEGIGISPEALLTVIKNTPDSGDPVLIEIHESRFMIGRDLAKEICLSPALDQEKILFQGNQTKQRQIVIDILRGIEGHFSLEELTEKVQKRDAKIGSITIYRTVKVLLQRGILEGVDLPDGSRKYEVIKGHHDHIVCENCGAIYEFHDEEIEKIQEKIAQKEGIDLTGHRMILYGKNCEKCRE